MARRTKSKRLSVQARKINVTMASSVLRLRKDLTNTIWAMGYKTPYSSAPVASLDLTNLTHVINVGYDPNTDGSLTNLCVYEDAMIAAAHAAGKGILLDVMGLDGDLNTAWTNAPTTLVANIVAAMNAKGYDGVDLDWEQNWDASKITAMLAALRAAIGSSKILTIAFPGQHHADLGPMHQYVDRVNMMTYDQSGAWDPYSWFDSALFADVPVQVGSMELVANRAIAAGVPNEKVGVGLSFFGKKSIGGTPALNAPRQAYGSPAPTITELKYNTMLATYLAEVAAATWDALAHMYWFPLTSPSVGWINFNGPRSIADKVAWAKNRGLGGWVIWNIDFDYIATGGTLAEKHPLLAMATP